MRIALVGADGQLGTALQGRLAHDVIALRHGHIEITDGDSVRRALDSAVPDLVINAAAYNLVDQAEDEPQAAYAANALGPRNLARYCAHHDIPLLHVSSDFVFGLDAARTAPYVETDAPGPQSAYAVSKLAGEYYVCSIAPRSFIVRTCGLYGWRSAGRGKGNFVTTMLWLGRDASADEPPPPEFLRVVDDQTCTPTSTEDLAGAVAALIETDAYGLYHATNAGSTTWCAFARKILEIAGLSKEVRPITTAEFGAKARRPAYSVLDCSKLEAATGYRFRPWQDAVAEYVPIVQRATGRSS